MSFTDKLDMLMAKNKINKSILSREADIPYTTIDGFYKKGTDNIKLSTLKKIARYFNCSLDYLVDDDRNDNISTLAAHFENDEYTEDELNEIKQFAEFVKNKNKRN
jgi:DNA-binding Xre family transcriptional regulator